MNYYIEVLLLTTTGAENRPFTYEAEENLPLGSLVLAPLRSRKLKGLVVGKVKKPDFPTKTILKIMSREPVLSETQLKLAKKISDYYLAPLGETIACILSFDFGKKRRPLSSPQPATHNLQPALKLTTDQQKIYQNINDSVKSSRFLIFGVTGSGKTEIYLQLVSNALKKDKGSIILVPEISLTPQIAERFEKRFGNLVAIWHSGLKETEKYDTWQKIKAGEKKVVLGARSAIFAPIPELGYIFIDEEHESSYKQDQNPRYETARVAEWLSELTGAKLVLGSATPKVDTFYRTERDDFRLLTLKKRIIQDKMPPVKIVDLRDEFKKGNKSIFSDDLYEAISEALKDKKQVLLFVNRRGASTFVVCRDCGYVSECPNCEIPLTYHALSSKKTPDHWKDSAAQKQLLRCHHCHYQTQIPTICPNCKSHAIRYFGLGTQRVEIEAKKMFANAKIARMDHDTTRKRGSHEEIFNHFAQKDFDILIGTQLVAKGWDLPNISVVGVISADTMLNLPDFRSAERTFSLLTQVAGRTGRGYHPGRVLIQTYSPENYAILAASNHDFEEFYRREIKERKQYNYPPFSTMVKLTYSAKDEKKAAGEASKMADLLKNLMDFKEIQILGPNPSFLPKIAGKYRWQVIIRMTNGKENEVDQKNALKIIEQNYRPGWTIDINPESLL